MIGILVLGFGLWFTALLKGGITIIEYFTALGILGCPLAYLLASDRGYRLSYDSEAIYRRPPGINLQFLFLYYPEQKMQFDEIKAMRGEWGGSGFRESGGGIAVPFRHIRLYRRNGDENELFDLDPLVTRHEELQELVRHILEKRPDLESKKITDYLNSSRRI